MTELLGIGAAIIDRILPVSEEYLETIQGERWGSEPVSRDELVQIIKNSGSVPQRTVGGSAANAIKGLASLGHSCGFLSMIGEDEEGELVAKDLKQLGIVPYLHSIAKPTGQVVSLITPDGKRTMRWIKGASNNLKPEHLHPSLFAGLRHVHMEGYLLYNDTVVERGMQMAKESGATVSFDLSSFEVVEKYRDRILHLSQQYVDILFANADEASALTHLSLEHACREMMDLSDLVVVMDGIDGSIVGEGRRVRRFRAYPVDPVDSTGAGDLFSSGFLHGVLTGKSIETCAKYGAILGREVVKVIGAEISAERWRELLPL